MDNTTRFARYLPLLVLALCVAGCGPVVDLPDIPRPVELPEGTLLVTNETGCYFDGYEILLHGRDPAKTGHLEIPPYGNVISPPLEYGTHIVRLHSSFDSSCTMDYESIDVYGEAVPFTVR